MKKAQIKDINLAISYKQKVTSLEKPSSKTVLILVPVLLVAAIVAGSVAFQVQAMWTDADAAKKSEYINDPMVQTQFSNSMLLKGVQEKAMADLDVFEKQLALIDSKEKITTELYKQLKRTLPTETTVKVTDIPVEQNQSSFQSVAQQKNIPETGEIVIPDPYEFNDEPIVTPSPTPTPSPSPTQEKEIVLISGITSYSFNLDEDTVVIAAVVKNELEASKFISRLDGLGIFVDITYAGYAAKDDVYSITANCFFKLPAAETEN